MGHPAFHMLSLFPPVSPILIAISHNEQPIDSRSKETPWHPTINMATSSQVGDWCYEASSSAHPIKESDNDTNEDVNTFICVNNIDSYVWFVL